MPKLVDVKKVANVFTMADRSIPTPSFPVSPALLNASNRALYRHNVRHDQVVNLPRAALPLECIPTTYYVDERSSRSPAPGDPRRPYSSVPDALRQSARRGDCAVRIVVSGQVPRVPRAQSVITRPTQIVGDPSGLASIAEPILNNAGHDLVLRNIVLRRGEGGFELSPLVRQEGGSLAMTGVVVTNLAGVGLHASNGALLNLSNVIVARCGREGIVADTGAQLSLRGGGISFCGGIGLVIAGSGTSVRARTVNFMENNPTLAGDRSPVGQVHVSDGGFLLLSDSELLGSGDASVGVVALDSTASLFDVIVAGHNIQAFVVRSHLLMRGFALSEGGTGLFLQDMDPAQLQLNHGLFQTREFGILISPCTSPVLPEIQAGEMRGDLRFSDLVGDVWSCSSDPSPPNINVTLPGMG